MIGQVFINNKQASTHAKPGDPCPTHNCALVQIMVELFAEDADIAYGVPTTHLLEIGMPYEISES